MRLLRLALFARPEHALSWCSGSTAQPGHLTMIESCYWKEELARIANTIRVSKRPTRWTERAHCVVERDLMIGFFMVRRLIELHKVSSSTRDMSMSVFSCPSRGKPIHFMNAHHIDEVYDLGKERAQVKKPLYVSNQFIHAYTSYVIRDKSRNWSAVYIVSDYDRKTCIWRIPISEVRRLFCVAAGDDMREMRFLYNEQKGDYDVHPS